MGHFLKGEWDDAQVDAGRFCDAALRYLEFRMTGSFTPIDGKSKPNRKTTVNKARQDTALPPSLRSQIPQSVELTMDFRNNRNSAHLGNIDANKLDATTVVQNVTWIIEEIVRLETQNPPPQRFSGFWTSLPSGTFRSFRLLTEDRSSFSRRWRLRTRQWSSSTSRLSPCRSRPYATGSGMRTRPAGETRSEGPPEEGAGPRGERRGHSPVPRRSGGARADPQDRRPLNPEALRGSGSASRR